MIDELGLGAEDAAQLTADKSVADYFELSLSGFESGGEQKKHAKLHANWILGELAGYLNSENKTISESPVSAEQLARLIARIEDNTISGKIAKEVFKEMWVSGDPADTIIERKGLKQITDAGAIEQIVDEVLARSSAQIEQYRSGQEKVFGYFVGQVMKATQGKANPQQVNEILRSKLDA